MQLAIPQSLLNKKTRLHISIKNDIEFETVQIWSGIVTSVVWHHKNVTAAYQGAGEEMKKNNIRRKRDHLTSFRK